MPDNKAEFSLKCLLSVVGGAGTLMVTIITSFIYITINSQQTFMRDALLDHTNQITQVLELHASSIHDRSVPIELWENEIPRLRAGIEENRSWDEKITHEVMEQWQAIRSTQKDINSMQISMTKIVNKLEAQ